MRRTVSGKMNGSEIRQPCFGCKIIENVQKRQIKNNSARTMDHPSADGSKKKGVNPNSGGKIL